VIEVGGGGALLRYSTPEGQPLGSLDEAGLVKLSEVNGMCAESLKSEANPTGAPPPFFFSFFFFLYLEDASPLCMPGVSFFLQAPTSRA
jgi:hypothetical protein